MRSHKTRIHLGVWDSLRKEIAKSSEPVYLDQLQFDFLVCTHLCAQIDGILLYRPTTCRHIGLHGNSTLSESSCKHDSGWGIWFIRGSLPMATSAPLSLSLVMVLLPPVCWPGCSGVAEAKGRISTLLRSPCQEAWRNIKIYKDAGPLMLAVGC